MYIHKYTYAQKKKKFNFFFDSLYKSIVLPFTEMDFYNVVTAIYATLKDCPIILLPSKEAKNYYNPNTNFFPFYVALLNSKL